MSSEDWNEANDSNLWTSDENLEEKEDWQETMARRNDGSFWETFKPSAESNQDTVATDVVVDEAEAWLDTLQSIGAEEVEFNMAEAERADKVRQMQEWGFDDKTITNTFGVAVDDTLEKEEVEGMMAFREDSFWDDEDWKKVESHSKVEKDPDTAEPVRQQMVGSYWLQSFLFVNVFKFALVPYFAPVSL
jgi:hypothetical protein